MKTAVHQLLLLAGFLLFASAHANESGFRDALLLEL